LIDASNNHIIDKLLSLLSDDIRINSPIYGSLNGKDKVKEFLCEIYQYTFPNLFMKLIISMYNPTTKVIAAEIEFGGKQSGRFIGNPGIGNSFIISGVFIFVLNEYIKLKD
jgi:SnoaL-like polyketide cyclase